MPAMEALFHVDWTFASLMALLTLTILEIVLGIDNVIFIAILASKLPKELQKRARQIGLLLAMGQRIVLLFLAFLVIQLDKHSIIRFWKRADESATERADELAHAAEGAGEHAPAAADAHHATSPYWVDLSAKDLIVLLGGVFLIYKAVKEIHEKLEGDPEGHMKEKAAVSMKSVLIQICLLDLVFSVDSVLTAVGLTDQLPIMIVAVVTSVIVMMVFADAISSFVERHPTIKMLALAILVMIGTLLIAEAFSVHVPRGYLYFAMAFAFIVEMLNIKAGQRRKRKAQRAAS